jgi:hydrogenase-4 component B
MSTSGLLLAAAAALGAGVTCAPRAPRVWLALTIGGCAAALGAAARVLVTGERSTFGGTLTLGGEALRCQLDGLGAWFLALLAVVGAAGAVYAHEYWCEERHPRSARAGRAWWSVLLLCMGVVFVAANGLHFLIAWELFTVAAFALITLDRQRGEARAAGWLYLAASHVGTLALFAFFGLLAARTGGWELGPLRERADLAPLFWLALFGFGLKAGLFPLHVWLPSAHASAPSHVSAILSGVAIKLGIYGIVRFSGWLPTPPDAGWVLVGLGVTSAVLGAAFALAQHDLKRLLAYCSVENIGVILVAVGFALIGAERDDAPWGRLALAGGLLHVWNHGLFKSLLFLGAGSVLHTTGTRRMTELGGLWRALPWTAATFAVGAAAIVALPPLNGFVSELGIYLGLLGAVRAGGAEALGGTAAIVLLALTGALALATFAKVVGVVFLGAPRTPAARAAHECGPWMRAPLVALASGCVLCGVLPVALWRLVAVSVDAWRPAATASASASVPALAGLGLLLPLLLTALVVAAAVLARRVRPWAAPRRPTWDCGYALPTPRMQSSAGSFAAIAVAWFAAVLRPERRVHTPDEVLARRQELDERFPEVVLERIVQPISAAVSKLANGVRRLQHGRAQTYLVYVLVGLLMIALLEWTGGAP